MKIECKVNIKSFGWLLLLWLVGGSAIAEVRGIVVGINQYPKIPGGNLDGAVNDAEDVADAMRKSGAKDITLLLDRKATRAAVVRAWRRMLNKSKAGDVLLFSFAGHGIQVPERVPGSEADHMDEALALTGFTMSPLNRERLIDDDIAAFLQRASDLGVQVLFLADACHSGTMTRGIDTRVREFKVRALPPVQRGLADTVSDTDDDRVATEAAYVQVEDLPGISYVGAVHDNQLAPETQINGKSRGALSWAAAKAIRGNADMDNDGIITDIEFTNYVRDTVVARMEGQQEPSLPPQHSEPHVIFTDKTRSLSSNLASPIFTPPPLVPLPIAIQNSKIPPDQLIAQLTNVSLATNATAILLWDTNRGEILGTLGDVVANVHTGRGLRRDPEPCPVPADTRGFARHDNHDSASTATISDNTPAKPAPLTPEAKLVVAEQCASTKNDLKEEIPRVQAVVDKWRVVEMLRPYAEQQPMTITTSPNDKIFQDKEPISITISSQRHPYFTLFNMGSDGTINFLYPISSLNDPLQIPSGQSYKLDLTVQQPFGADHFVALTSAVPLTRLHTALAKLNGSQTAAELLDILKTELAAPNIQVGMRGVYTGKAQ